jgi:hypothetical protein
MSTRHQEIARMATELYRRDRVAFDRAVAHLPKAYRLALIFLLERHDAAEGRVES